MNDEPGEHVNFNELTTRGDYGDFEINTTQSFVLHISRGDITEYFAHSLSVYGSEEHEHLSIAVEPFFSGAVFTNIAKPEG